LPAGFLSGLNFVQRILLGAKMVRVRFGLALFVGACSIYGASVGARGAAAQAQGSRANKLTIEQVVAIKHPSDPLWSPDGKRIAFVWDQGGIGNLYLANTDGSSSPVALTSFPDGHIFGAFWSHDGQAIYFPHDGDLWKVDVSSGQPSAVWTTPASESGITPSPDGARVAFVRGGTITGFGTQSGGTGGGDLIVRSLADGSETQVAHDDVSIHGIVWSPDGLFIAYTAGAKVIPHDESPSYSGAKIVYKVSEYVRGQVYVAKVAGGDAKAVAIGTVGEYGGLAWLDSGHLVFDRQSNEFKTYSIYVADAATGSAKSIDEEKEEKFWSIPDWGIANAQPLPSPDGKWIAFLTDRDGWDHVYVMPASGGNAVQLTKGKFEAWRPVWSHDGKRIAFDANEADMLGNRRVGIIDLAKGPASATITYITSGPGTNIDPQWSPDDSQVVFQHTDTHNSADLYTLAINAAAASAKPARLSDSMPAGIDKSQFIEPRFVRFPGADGQMVPGWLFVPKGLDKTKKHPVIIWIHGDGVNQNYNGWHVQRNYAVYYSIHQYFLQKGYIVFAPDYRGSIGYGRDWRTGVHMDVGGKDAKDAWMSANYLKTLAYVDPDRIGIWGLSYGGFFTLIAMTDQPTLFRAGVDVAGVADYVMYYSDPYHGEWTASRIGTPEQNPEVYKNASPLSHIDRLERPLLVLHGTADVNVPFLESVWLMDEALKKGKGPLVSFMIYPGEFHYFTRTHILLDAWHRVDDFFDLHLRDVTTAGR
jgi:dipeptidyl aminopeptidase/acylaminoacyl peptidase